MSLYYEAAKFLSNDPSSGGSLRSRVYAVQDTKLKSHPSHIYALASEVTQWSPVLAPIIEVCGLLEQERKLSPELALLLVHDLLLNKKGVAAPTSHPLRLAVERHKARLKAELVRIRLKHKCASLEDLKRKITLDHENGARGASDWSGYAHPRWVRINTMKTTLRDQLDTTFSDCTIISNIEDLYETGASRRIFRDQHVPNLLALPPSTDLTKTTAYLGGNIILQDKASCFPAYLLDVASHTGDIIDACAAPGNKTTHLAAISLESDLPRKKRMIHAFERDRSRSQVLQQTIKSTGAHNVRCYPGTDFLSIDSDQPPWTTVTALLLDPSCSGSGMIDRDEAPLVLPKRKAQKIPTEKGKPNGKRKRHVDDDQGSEEESYRQGSAAAAEKDEGENLRQRLKALSTFQLKLILHAFKFPRAKRIAYSTCSIYDEENEAVVKQALDSDIAKARGWRLLKREEQIDGMRRWHVRGRQQAFMKSYLINDYDGFELAESCIRCEKGTADGTQGFFAVCFVTDAASTEHHDSPIPDDNEWEGFAD